ncbi:MAG: diguanylate cyclase [Anaerolineales bacterium]|nr:diguanylate cyclase [Anaerolineales bacterium]
MTSLSPKELAYFWKQASLMTGAVEHETTQDSLSFFKRLAKTPALLDQWASEVTLQAGEVLFDEGESGEALYLILDGKTAVITDRAERPNLIAVRGAGEIIGEMALVEGRPRMATVAALSPARLLCINKVGFNQLIQSKPEFGLELMRILSNRLRAETHRQAQPAPKEEPRDTLTGVHTRATFDQSLSKMHQRGKNFSLLMLDLDHFKSINDGFGHARGDEALKEFAQRTQSALREEDLLFRYGGDEFCVLLPEIDAEQATSIAQRILNAVRETPLPGTPPLTLTLSIGAASFSADMEEPATMEDLLKVADRRAYQAKRAGRARVVGSFEPVVESSREDDSAPEISRLIDREKALETMRGFFDELEIMRHGGIWVRGDLGCGQSRFLREIAAHARLRNYAVFFLSGMPELQKESYGVVRVAHESQTDITNVWTHPVNPTPLAEALTITLPPFVVERQNHGVLIVLDNVDWVDPATCSGLQQLVQTHFIFPIGLAYAGATKSILADDINQTEIKLSPLTAHGVQLWLRHNVGWDAPQDFVQWLYQSTDGKPALLQKEVAQLVESGKLTLTSDGWSANY